jgi:HD-like signal output (HDOD) protein/GGDEF domain-containing protein
MSETVGLVQQFVERAGQLYSLPAVAAEVFRLTSEPRVDGRALKECLERDPALTARLLRVVNSSLFGLNRPVTDLGQALSLIGIRPLKMLVLGFSLPRELFAGLEARVLAHYWRRTLVKALAARELAERFWRIPGDEAFTAGLVQDIGILALVQQLGAPYQQFLAHAREHGGNLLDHELETLGFDHLVLSSRLLRHWGFPEPFCALIGLPPTENRVSAAPAEHRVLAQVLHLAELLAQLIEQPYGSALQQLLTSGQRHCGLTYETLQPLVQDLHAKVAELASVLALELPDGTSYVDLLLTARSRLADQTLEAATKLAAPVPEEELLALTTELRRELAAASRRGPKPVPLPADSPALHQASRRQHAQATLEPAAKPGPAAPAVIDSALYARASAAIQRCRHARRPVTLAVLEIDDFSDVLLRVGPVGASALAQRLGEALMEWTGQSASVNLVNEHSLAMIWEGATRSEAVRQARQAAARSKVQSRNWLGGVAEISVSLGLATLESPPKNYPPEALIEAAERCLSAAQLSGGDTVKSIEL